jgi:hypothetical protein
MLGRHAPVDHRRLGHAQQPAHRAVHERHPCHRCRAGKAGAEQEPANLPHRPLTDHRHGGVARDPERPLAGRDVGGHAGRELVAIGRHATLGWEPRAVQQAVTETQHARRERLKPPCHSQMLSAEVPEPDAADEHSDLAGSAVDGVVATHARGDAPCAWPHPVAARSRPPRSRGPHPSALEGRSGRDPARAASERSTPHQRALRLCTRRARAAGPAIRPEASAAARPTLGPH